MDENAEPTGIALDFKERHMHLRRLVCFLTFLTCLVAALNSTPLSAFAAGTGSITGSVVSANNGSPVQGAKVDLAGGGGAFTTSSAKDGSFSFTGLQPATYVVHVAAKLFQNTESVPLPLADGQTISLVVVLQPVTTTNISSLGRVTVKGHAVLNTSSAASTTITNTQFINQGATQVQSALETLPGITLERYDGSAPGTVTTFTIRGAGAFGGGIDGTSNTGYEILVLQDGEPMRNGQYGDFDASQLTPAIYSRVEVIEGLGGTSLFGANTIGGTINLVTRDPAKTEGGEFILSAGGFGTTDYNLSETNTFGRFGYLIDLHRYGTSGFVPSPYLADFSGVIAQPTQTMNLKSGLAKIRYDFSNSSYLSLDSSLESDYRDQLGLVSNPNTNPDGSPQFDAQGIPSFFGFPGDFVWNMSPKYSADFGTSLGGGTLILRYYQQYLQRVVDGLNEPASICCFESRSIDRLSGALASWTKAFGNNSLTLATGANSDNFYFGEDLKFSQETFEQLAPLATGTQLERTYLVRDDYSASPKLDLTMAGYYSSYDTLQVKRFDPRLAAVYKPDQNSVFRLSVGTGFAPPRLSDLFSILDLSRGNNASQCPPFPNNNCVATDGNPNLKAETAVGADIGYQRTFQYDGDLNLDLYRTNLTNHIFDGIFPAPAGLKFGNGSPVLFISKSINLAHAVYQGVEVGGTAPFNGNFSAHLMYDIESAYPTGVDAPTAALLGDVVNNQQFLGVPVQKYGWALNYHNLSHSTTMFIGANYYGHNNSYNVNPFWVYNAGSDVPVGADRIHIAWTNIFNANAGIWSQFQLGNPIIGAPGYNNQGNCFPHLTSYLYCTNAYPTPPHELTISYDHRWGSLR